MDSGVLPVTGTQYVGTSIRSVIPPSFGEDLNGILVCKGSMRMVRIPGVACGSRGPEPRVSARGWRSPKLPTTCL